MKVGQQFLIAVRLLTTVKGLSSRLTVSGRSGQAHLYCRGNEVLFIETSTRFPFSWLVERRDSVAGALQAATVIDDKLRAFQSVVKNDSLRRDFRTAAFSVLADFFRGDILECRMKQEPPLSALAAFTLQEGLFGCGRTFIGTMHPDEMLPSREIPFRQSPEFVARSAGLKMAPQDGYLLSRLEQPVTVGDILSTVPGDEMETKRSLLIFWAFGVLDSPVLNQMVPKVDVHRDIPKESASPAPAAPASTAFEDSSAEQLAANVEQTYRSLSKKDFYTLLDVTGRADLGEIKAAYYRLARKFHPDRFYGMHDPVLKEKVDVIFSAINVAYETLRNSKRRLEYDNAPVERKVIGATTLNSENTTTTLTKETVSRVAEEHSQKAQKCYEEGNYYQAVQFLRSATQIAPDVPRYWRQLGISLSRNPQWRKEAEDSFQRAMELDPKNPENHLYLGFLYKNSGLKLRSKKHFQICHEMDPSNEIASRELHLLDAEELKEAEPPASSKKGLLGNIFKKK